ncbi:LytR C-terminal domain-containing protein [Nostocoides sp. HKS02]|uniref:LytR C-terminal domain-containing protein n=1 Tax=Nostocoides sp. HKS02 TaxID=1813880 RepID=UPI0018A82058|nr:LytR C-terminal domain-containing protein [Tetrasphaera sp. HKS02]
MSPRPAAPDLDPRIWRSRRNRKLAAFLCLPGLTLGTVTLVGANAAGLLDSRVDRICTASAHVLPKAGSVRVGVYNASGVAGMASRTAAQLATKGFRVVSIGNAPETRWFTGAPRVIHGTGGTDQAALVASSLPGAVQVSDGRGDSSVDVLLGAGPAVSAMRPAATHSTAPACG